MDKLAAIILSILMSIPSYYKDVETKEERENRMEVVATSISNVSRLATCTGPWEGNEGCKPMFKGTPRELATALVTIAYHESTFAKHIHEGNCRPKECDAISYYDHRQKKRVTYFRARSMWQMHRSSKIRNEWDSMVGTTQAATDSAALAATKIWSGCFSSSSNVLNAFKCYGGGTKDRTIWPGGKLRVDFYNRWLHAPVAPYQRTKSSELDSDLVAVNK